MEKSSTHKEIIEAYIKLYDPNIKLESILHEYWDQLTNKRDAAYIYWIYALEDTLKGIKAIIEVVKDKGVSIDLNIEIESDIDSDYITTKLRIYFDHEYLDLYRYLVDRYNLDMDKREFIATKYLDGPVNDLWMMYIFAFTKLASNGTTISTIHKAQKNTFYRDSDNYICRDVDDFKEIWNCSTTEKFEHFKKAIERMINNGTKIGN